MAVVATMVHSGDGDGSRWLDSGLVKAMRWCKYFTRRKAWSLKRERGEIQEKQRKVEVFATVKNDDHGGERRCTMKESRISEEVVAFGG